MGNLQSPDWFRHTGEKSINVVAQYAHDKLIEISLAVTRHAKDCFANVGFVLDCLDTLAALLVQNCRANHADSRQLFRNALLAAELICLGVRISNFLR